MAEYNSLARKLKLIPSDAENAKGIDFELRLTFGNQASMSDFMNTIKVTQNHALIFTHIFNSCHTYAVKYVFSFMISLSIIIFKVG